MFPARGCQALEKSKRKYSAFKGVFCWEHSPKTFIHIVLVALVSLSGDNECSEIIFITLKKKSQGDEQTGPWLRTHIALWADLTLVLSTHIWEFTIHVQAHTSLNNKITPFKKKLDFSVVAIILHSYQRR